jgi:uncharacterized membrane protein YbhN (UPF0104 family)
VVTVGVVAVMVPDATAEGTGRSPDGSDDVTSVMSGSSRLSVWIPRLFSAAVFALLFAAAFRLRGNLLEAVRALFSLPHLTVLSVLGIFGAVLVARALLYRWSLPRSTIGRGVLLDQVGLAVGNAVPGGGVVSGALRYRIGRSFRHSPDEIAICLLAVGEAMSVARWLLVVVVLGASLLLGAGSGFDLAVLGSAALAVGASAVLWLVISRDTRLTRWMVRVGQRLVDRVGRRVAFARGVHLEPFALGLRSGAAWIVSARAGRLLVAAAAVTLGGAAIVVLVVQAVGGADAPAAFDIVRVYLLARLAAGLSPTPGGVGVVEGALGAGLVAAGADPAAALAGILVYRGLTYVLPILTGSAAYLGWRRWERRHRFDPFAVEPPARVERRGPALDPGAACPALALVGAGAMGQTDPHGAGAGGR